MTLTVKHAFVSNIADDPTAAAAGEVLPSNWNANHTITGTVDSSVGARTLLTSNITRFVRTTGSDSNGGTNSTTDAWATMAHAILVIQAYDFSGFHVTLDVGAGTFRGCIISGLVGGGILQINGAGSASTTLTNQDGTNATDVIDVTAQTSSVVGVNKFKFTAVAGTFSMLGTFAAGNTLVTGDAIVGGNADLIFVPPDGAVFLFNDFQSTISINAGNYTLDGTANSGGAGTGQGIFGTGGAYTENFGTWTFTNSPNYSANNFTAFIGLSVNTGFIDFSGGAFSGTLNGLFLSSVQGSAAAIVVPGTYTYFVDQTSSLLNSGPGVGEVAFESISGAPNTTFLPKTTHGMFKDSGQSTATKGIGVYANDAGTVFPLTPLRTTFANLPASPHQGDMASITDGKAINCGDGSCTTFGTTVTAGGGALNLLIWYNGTNWTLMGK